MDNAKCVHALTVQYVQPAAVASINFHIFPFISSACFFFISFFFFQLLLVIIVSCYILEMIWGFFPLKKNHVNTCSRQKRLERWRHKLHFFIANGSAGEE